MKFLVTGGAGFIGSHLTQFLVKNKDHVIVVDNLEAGKLENIKNVMGEIEFHELDILNLNGMKKLAKDVDGIFHQAGLTSVQESFLKKKKYFDVNVTGTENILKLAKEFGLKVVFASSASVYGDPNVIPIRETHEKKPLSPYGQTKLESEILAKKYADYGVSVIGLRYFNVYGPNQNDMYAGVITKFLENVRKGKPPVIFGDGLQIRDFIFVGDVVKANMAAMKNDVKHALINVGSDIGMSIQDLAHMIIRSSGLITEPIYADAQKGDIRSSQANIRLANDLLKWKPQVSLKEWLDETLQVNL